MKTVLFSLYYPLCVSISLCLKSSLSFFLCKDRCCRLNKSLIVREAEKLTSVTSLWLPLVLLSLFFFPSLFQLFFFHSSTPIAYSLLYLLSQPSSSLILLLFNVFPNMGPHNQPQLVSPFCTFLAPFHFASFSVEPFWKRGEVVVRIMHLLCICWLKFLNSRSTKWIKWRALRV